MSAETRSISAVLPCYKVERVRQHHVSGDLSCKQAEMITQQTHKMKPPTTWHLLLLKTRRISVYMFSAVTAGLMCLGERLCSACWHAPSARVLA